MTPPATPDASAGRVVDRGGVLAGVLGILCLIWSFLPFYTASVPDLPTSLEGDAWTGYFGWAGCLVAMGAGVALVVASVTTASAGTLRTVGVVLMVLAAVLMVIALFANPTIDCGDTAVCNRLLAELEYGRAIGYWLALISTVVAAALACLSLVRARRG